MSHTIFRHASPSHLVNISSISGEVRKLTATEGPKVARRELEGWVCEGGGSNKKEISMKNTGIRAQNCKMYEKKCPKKKHEC